VKSLALATTVYSITLNPPIVVTPPARILHTGFVSVFFGLVQECTGCTIIVLEITARSSFSQGVSR
jgi:hypothetical protein